MDRVRVRGHCRVRPESIGRQLKDLMAQGDRSLRHSHLNIRLISRCSHKDERFNRLKVQHGRDKGSARQCFDFI